MAKKLDYHVTTLSDQLYFRKRKAFNSKSAQNMLTCCWWICFSTITYEFFVPQMRQFRRLTLMILIAEDDFVRKISINFFLLYNPFYKPSSLCVVNRLQFLSQLNFVRMKMKIFVRILWRELVEMSIFDHSAKLMFLDS